MTNAALDLSAFSRTKQDICAGETRLNRMKTAQMLANHVTRMTTARVAGATFTRFLTYAELSTRKMAASSSTSSSNFSNELVDCRRLGQAGSSTCQRLQNDAECPDSVLDNCSIRASGVCPGVTRIRCSLLWEACNWQVHAIGSSIPTSHSINQSNPIHIFRGHHLSMAPYKNRQRQTASLWGPRQTMRQSTVDACTRECC